MVSQKIVDGFNSNLACACFQGVPYFKVTLNSHVLKGYIEFKLFFNRVYWK